MKKIAISAVLAIATLSAMADSVFLEHQSATNTDGSAGQVSIVMGVKHNINDNFAVDTYFTNTQTENTNALGTRLEVGATGTYPVAGVNLYTRVAVGDKYSNTTDYTYYSIEPGVKIPVGAFTLSVSDRFRRAVDEDAHYDPTHTMRYGVSYAVTKNDTVGVRYDQLRGTASQNITSVNFTHNF